MGYEKKATIACVNFGGEWGNKAARLKKMKTQVKLAARQGVDIIVFPELALSGYQCDKEGSELMKPCAMHADAAETVPGPAAEEMAKLAKEHGIYIIFGMPERDKADPSIHYNAAAVVAPEGILGTYRKMHLVAPTKFTSLADIRESTCFAPGTELPVWETRFGPIGVLICLDFNFIPELTRILVLKGARLVVNVSASPSGHGKAEFWSTVHCCRAAESGIYTAGANLVGKDREMYFCGHSTIAGPTTSRYAEVLAQADDTEEIVCATMNFDLVDYWNYDMLNWRRLRQTHLIAKEFAELAKAGSALEAPHSIRA